MNRRVLSLLCLLLSLAACSFAQEIPEETFQLQMEADEESLGMLEEFERIRATLNPAQNKVSSAFWSDMGIELHPSLAKRHERSINENGQETIRIEIEANVTQELLDLIQVYGEVLFSSAEYGAITAEIPATLVEHIASMDDVISISPLQEYESSKINISQGVASHRVNNLRSSVPKATGSGIKVGVLSDSVTYLSQVQSSGDLPSVTVLPNRAGSGKSEGTAMLEIIYDLAPQAKLYFSTAGLSQAAFATNIIALADAGCKVIVDDIVFIGEPAYEDGPIAQAVDKVAARGVAYFSSASNYGNLVYGTAKVWEGDYRPVASSLPSSIGRVYRDVHYFSTSSVYATLTGTGAAMYVTLHWADKMNAPETDYDLIILNGNGKLVTFSSSRTKAFEMVTLPASTATYRIFVARYSGPAKLFSIRSTSGKLSPATKGYTHGHSSAKGAFSIAATFRQTTGSFYDTWTSKQTIKAQYYSSQGPRRIYFENGVAVTPGVFTSAGGKIRNKPDFTAADGVLTATPGFSSFYGTSCAAPHAAGIAATLFSVFPTMSLAQLRSAFASSSIDILASGWDDVSGYGLLDAVRAHAAARTIMTATTSTSPTSAPISTTAPTSAPTSAPSTGTSCPAQTYARANWKATAPGIKAIGSCISGWTGSPNRICGKNGVWQDLVNNHCVRV